MRLSHFYSEYYLLPCLPVENIGKAGVAVTLLWHFRSASTWGSIAEEAGTFFAPVLTRASSLLFHLRVSKFLYTFTLKFDKFMVIRGPSPASSLYAITRHFSTYLFGFSFLLLGICRLKMYAYVHCTIFVNHGGSINKGLSWFDPSNPTASWYRQCLNLPNREEKG